MAADRRSHGWARKTHNQYDAIQNPYLRQGHYDAYGIGLRLKSLSEYGPEKYQVDKMNEPGMKQ
ncbi:hypothetical protein PABG_04212 [Paracoccidioides brasiliensis Pb03]|uniref:Uncharacterized protein n=2 Tax=Paracoccidioides brasiliensis TaxID=121759 RepID=C1GC58_PARBD|nr:uncharacterized protein PADG_04580 [Paracoccidioides brasiliensis Pb18]EEH22001.2 hypothetical protein PABG_04212 [Paracoccidioides brasiliensis Pb03]EEH48501.2 hypothetical protein PADG_04580 [Paracoccidioides brasiliensis Pb18]ODH26756.1 hypothetical protein ACO22_04441 [Paracoccidioides brasiliensis]ODH46304.1 hypothetical protein GX48_07611 [Paracoccidioides brasiliensis]